jgi:hypothetical protein
MRVAAGRKINIPLWCRLRLFLEGVQDPHRVEERRQVDDPERPAILPDFTSPRTYRFIGFQSSGSLPI